MKKLCESTPRVACGTHRTHTHVAHGTQQCSSGMIFAESPKKGAGALDHNRLSTIIVLQQQQQWCCICDSMHVSHNNRGHQLYRSQGPIKKAAIININNRKPQQYSADNLPHTRDVASSCYAGGWQACIQRYSQLVVAHALHCSCSVCCPWCLGYVLTTLHKKQKRIKRLKINGHDDLCEDRTRAFKSKIGRRDHLTISPKIQIVWWYFSRRARHTPHIYMHNSIAAEREVVMTEDGSQPPTKHLPYSTTPRTCDTHARGVARWCWCWYYGGP